MKTIHSRCFGMLLLLFTITNTAPTMTLLSVKNNRNDGDDVSQLYRLKPSERGYIRGQTQSQYINFGKQDIDAGKAEAEATESGSRTTVYGSQGMGQAQSQFSMGNCNECFSTPGMGIPDTLSTIRNGQMGRVLHPSTEFEGATNKTWLSTGVPRTADSAIPQTIDSQDRTALRPGSSQISITDTSAKPRGGVPPSIGSSYTPQGAGGATYAPSYRPDSPYINGGGTIFKTQPTGTSTVPEEQKQPMSPTTQIGQFPQGGTHFISKPTDTSPAEISPSFLSTPSYGDKSRISTDNKINAYDPSPEGYQLKIIGQSIPMGSSAPSGTPAFKESTAQPYTPIFDSRPTAPGSSVVIPQPGESSYGTYSTHPLKPVFANGQQHGGATHPILYPSGYKPDYNAATDYKGYRPMGSPGVGIGVGQIITIAPIHPQPEFIKQNLPPSIHQPSLTFNYPSQPASPQSSVVSKPSVTDIYKQTTGDSISKTGEYPAPYNTQGTQIVIPTDVNTRGFAPSYTEPRLQYTQTLPANAPHIGGLQPAVQSQAKSGILHVGQVAYTSVPSGNVYLHPNQVKFAPQAVQGQGYPKQQLSPEYSQPIPTAGISRDVMQPREPTQSIPTLQQISPPTKVDIQSIPGYSPTSRDVIPQQHVVLPDAVSTVTATVPQTSLPTYTSTQSGLGYMQPATSGTNINLFQDTRLQPPSPYPSMSGTIPQPQGSFAVSSNVPKYIPATYTGLQQPQPGIVYTDMPSSSVHAQPGTTATIAANNEFFVNKPQLAVSGGYDQARGSNVYPETGQKTGIGMQTDSKQAMGTPLIASSTGYGTPSQSNVRYEQFIPTYDGSTGAYVHPGAVAGYPQTQFDVKPYQPGISNEKHTITLPQTGTVSTYTQPSQLDGSTRNQSIQQSVKEIFRPSPTSDLQGTLQAYNNDTTSVGLDKDNIFSQAESSISNGQASASAEGKKNGGSAKTLVQGTYSSTGSFSASAMTSDNDRSANSQVSGSVQGAMSQAQAQGGPAQSQAQVQINKSTGGTKASSQSGGLIHQSQSEVQANDKGGLADAQSSGPGQTSSQAQIGFRPADTSDNSQLDGVGQASSQSGLHSGQSQSQIQGKSKLGITYHGAAQSASGTKDQVAGYREKIKDVFNSITQFENTERSSNHLLNTNNPAFTSESRHLSDLQLKASKKAYKNVHFSNTSDDDNSIILGEDDDEDHYDEYDDDEDYNSDTSFRLRTHTHDLPLPTPQIPQKYNSTANSKVQKHNRHLVKYSSRSTTETIPNGFRGTINIEKNIHTKALQMQNSGKSVNSSMIDIKPRTHDSYVTVTKSVTGTMENSKDPPKDNRNFQSTFYTKSSTCGYFTFSCNIVYGENGRSKICRPKAPTKGNC